MGMLHLALCHAFGSVGRLQISINLSQRDKPLRHTHASHLIDAGIDVVKISRRLGHASPAITLRVYAHLFRKRDDKSSAAINTAVASLLN